MSDEFYIGYADNSNIALFRQRSFSGLMFPFMTFVDNEAELQFVRPKMYMDMQKSVLLEKCGSCLEIISESFRAMIYVSTFVDVKLEEFVSFQNVSDAYVYDGDTPRITYGYNNFEIYQNYQGPAISEKLAQRLDCKIFIAVTKERRTKKKRILFYLVLPPKSDVKVL